MTDCYDYAILMYFKRTAVQIVLTISVQFLIEQFFFVHKSFSSKKETKSFFKYLNINQGKNAFRSGL